jgi:Trk K+ transport system NAD-binding subunit
MPVIFHWQKQLAWMLPLCLPYWLQTRSHRFVLHGGAIATALLEGEKLEAIEFIASSSAFITGLKIKDAGLPEESTVVAVMRGNDVFLPPNDLSIEPDDHIVGCCTHQPGTRCGKTV